MTKGAKLVTKGGKPIPEADVHVSLKAGETDLWKRADAGMSALEVSSCWRCSWTAGPGQS